jgi:hypothetical protein
MMDKTRGRPARITNQGIVQEPHALDIRYRVGTNNNNNQYQGVERRDVIIKETKYRIGMFYHYIMTLVGVRYNYL